jgi:hypothetical protein
MEHGFPPLLALASTCFANAVYNAQWSPLLAAAFVILPLNLFAVAKPTIGLALFVARPTRWALWGGIALLALSFVLQPAWVGAWRAALNDTSLVGGGGFPYRPPASLPGGLIVLLALLRWRRPEARLLVALACVPQTLLPYEAVYLFLIPRGAFQAGIMLVASYVVSFWWVSFEYADVDLATFINIYAAGIVAFLYSPATIMVLCRRNEGPLPRWIEVRIARWPLWLRGAPDNA